MYRVSVMPRLGENRIFMKEYHRYIIEEWGTFYISYDSLKDAYKLAKGKISADCNCYERKIYNEIVRVNAFLITVIGDIDMDLKIVENAIEGTTSSNNGQSQRNIELSLRLLFEKITECEKFYHLNYFAFYKIMKKFNKLVEPLLLEQQNLDSVNSETEHLFANLENGWENYPCGRYFTDTFPKSLTHIDNLKNHCTLIYSKKFRSTYSPLALYELEFVKSKDRNTEMDRYYVGFKLGLIACLFTWLLCNSFYVGNDLDFWTQPGLFLCTAIGNFLLYRLCWAGNIFIWSKFGVNYISILQLSNLQPNLLLVVDHSATLLLFYFIILIIYLEANTPGTLLEHTFMSYGSPFILLLITIVYQSYEHFFLVGNERISRGLFSNQVFINCLKAPLIPLTFRDVFAADVTTSFTRIISDSAYASCWVLSGAFLTRHDTDDDVPVSTSTDFGSSYMNCSSYTMVVCAALLQLLPLIIRTLQCTRGCRDSHWNIYPQGWNTLKYLLSIVVVLLAVDTPSTEIYNAVVVLVTVYKWWWDVAMDWGMFEILPTWQLLTSKDSLYNKLNKMFLRPSTMYPSIAFYYFCIIADLGLRYLWVLSLLPPSTVGGFVSLQLSFFLGSMEIVRRSMWGILRVEWEHLKHLKQGNPGFLSTPVLRNNTRVPNVTNEGVRQNTKDVASGVIGIRESNVEGRISLDSGIYNLRSLSMVSSVSFLLEPERIVSLSTSEFRGTNFLDENFSSNGRFLSKDIKSSIVNPLGFENSMPLQDLKITNSTQKISQ